MKNQLKGLTQALSIAAALTFSTNVLAQTSAASAEMTTGEIRKVDSSTKKLTIRHAEIKSLDMPSMTMVFQVKDPAVIDKVKAGDKVRFRVIKEGSSYIVTDLEPNN